MIRFLLIDLLIVITVIGGGWVWYKSWRKSVEKKRLKYEAFFSGGPLHNKTFPMAKLPETYHYMYNKPKVVKVTEGQGEETTDAYFNALYDHQGGGTYSYKGSVPVDKLLQYDLGVDD